MKNFIVSVLTLIIAVLSGGASASIYVPPSLNGTDQTREYNREKKSIVVLSYNGSGQYGIPIENTYEGFPEAVPCNFITGRRNVVCDWNIAARESTVIVNCRSNICRQGGEIYGIWSENIDVDVNFLYFIKPTKDGKMMAVRRDLADSLNDWTYADAGAALYYWFMQYGVEKEVIESVMDNIYSGGVTQFEADYTAECDASGGCGD